MKKIVDLTPRVQALETRMQTMYTYIRNLRYVLDGHLKDIPPAPYRKKGKKGKRK